MATNLFRGNHSVAKIPFKRMLKRSCVLKNYAISKMFILFIVISSVMTEFISTPFLKYLFRNIEICISYLQLILHWIWTLLSDAWIRVVSYFFCLLNFSCHPYYQELAKWSYKKTSTLQSTTFKLVPLHKQKTQFLIKVAF